MKLQIQRRAERRRRRRVGTALGPQGVNIMDFCKNFNAKTVEGRRAHHPGRRLSCADRSYLHHQDAGAVLRSNLRREHRQGSAEPNKTKVGTVTRKRRVEDIAKLKMPDLNCDTLEAAVKTVAGTARSMGLDVIG